MRQQAVWLLFIIGVLTVTALSVGSPVFLMMAVLLLLVMVMGLVSVLWTASTLRTEVQLEEHRVCRGADVKLKVVVHCGGLLPIAPISVSLHTMPGTEQTVLRLHRANGKRQRTTTVLHCEHVGVCHPGVAGCTVEDCFGLFSRTMTDFPEGPELMVVPQTFEVAELTYAPGDPGMETLARATEDITDPSDFRAYAPGDPMKKIHWKLSMRKQELVVRRFEEPALPDALVLMDCSAPHGDSVQEKADIRDAMLETAASVMESARDGHQLRLPLMGAHPTQLASGMGMPLILENLARADFTETDRFERVLTMESRNMSRVGCLVIIVSRMNGQLTETIRQMRRMGPVVRLYLVTSAPENERLMRYVVRLQTAGVEVSYVTPLVC